MLILKYNQLLLDNKRQILQENLRDVKVMKRKHLIDRLVLDEKRIEGIRHSINEIVKFKSPLNRVLEDWRRPNGMRIKKVTTKIKKRGKILEKIVGELSYLLLEVYPFVNKYDWGILKPQIHRSAGGTVDKKDGF